MAEKFIVWLNVRMCYEYLNSLNILNQNRQ